jgi:Phosphoinositide phospholipase C, Ca2+-dependent
MTIHGSRVDGSSGSRSRTGLALTIGALCVGGLACARGAGGMASHDGATGTTGAAGAVASGAAGAPGTTGAAGTAGTAGATGMAGTTGTTGAAGATGAAGMHDAGVVSDKPAGAPGPDAAEARPGLDAPTADVGTRLATMTVEALQVAGTHNSYHQAPLVAFDASHAYTQKPLDQQLAGGVRALELDLHLASDGTFQIYHISVIDPNSSCQTLDACLGIIATWSTAHPRHTPIFLWFELKDDTGGSPINDVVPIEAVLLKAFTRDRIMTPAWLRGTYASPRARLMAAGWPALDEARGKIMFSIITHDARTQAYSHGGTSLDDRLMWLKAEPTEFGLPWAAVTKDLEDPALIANAHAAHILLGVNTCAINMTDDACTARLQQFASAGVHMLADDLPFQISGRSYWLRLPGGSPGCNPVTAPPSCATPLE